MPHKPVKKLPPIDLGEKTIGQRISKLRKEQGLTQQELADKIGTARGVVSDYERGRIRLYDEMVARFAKALKTTTDNIIGYNLSETENREIISLRFSRRIKEIETLPEHKIKNILKTLDDLIKANKE